MSEKMIAGFGEVMLRLAPAGVKRFKQALPGALEATYGGGEANVCASLAMFGLQSCYLTALPANPIADACLQQLRGIGVNVDRVLLRKNGRMGVYYAEHGAVQRGSNVIYDREHSVIAEAKPADYDFVAMLENIRHLHVTGITPALSSNAYETMLALLAAAEKMGVTVSCDLNFRKKLWNWEPGTAPRELAKRCMTEIVRYADVIIGNEEDAFDVFGIAAEDSSIEEGELNLSGYTEVARALAKKFPKAKRIAITLRESYSANHNNWGGMLYDVATDKAFFAPLAKDGTYSPYEIRNIVDRFGGGDSFCAGLIYALHSKDYAAPETAIRFAVAASCLKHSISGDYNYSTVAEVVALMGGNASGRVAR